MACEGTLIGVVAVEGFSPSFGRGAGPVTMILGFRLDPQKGPGSTNMPNMWTGAGPQKTDGLPHHWILELCHTKTLTQCDT